MDYNEYKKKFDVLFTKRIVPYLAPLEAQRARTFQRFKTNFIAGAVVLSVIMLILPLRPFGMKVFFLLIFLIFLFALLHNLMLNKFKNSVKKQFLPSLLKVFGNFSLVKQDFVSLREIKKYKIFPKAAQKSNDDTIAGTYKGLDVYLQECELIHSSGKSSFTDFKGLIIKVKYPKKFQGTTVVRSNRYSEAVNGMEKVNLEDVEFEKEYNVYSTDQVEARFLLTTAFMERLKNLENAFNKREKQEVLDARQRQMREKLEQKRQGLSKPIADEMTTRLYGNPNSYCVFDDGFLILFVSTNQDLFEIVDPWKNMNDKKLYEDTFFQMISVFEMIQSLKADQKIGM